jgi:hypothetical protein
MANLTTAEVAAQLDTTPRTLRRFLRADAFYANVGCGGRYEFTANDMPTLSKRYAAWSSTKAAPVQRQRMADADTSDDGLSLELLTVPCHRLSSITRQRVAELTRTRDAKLIHAIQQLKQSA